MKNGADINQPTHVGRGYIDSFSMFITNSSYTQNGSTPLYRASQEGHRDTVATLIRNGAVINQPRNVGRGVTYGTLIMFTIYFSHTGWCNISVYS